MVRIRVAALVVRDGRVLLARHVKHGRTTFLLPGGGVEAAEYAHDALAREVREEASAVVEVGDLRYVVEAIAPDGSKHLVQLVFEATIEGAIGPSTDPRVAACEWREVAELATIDLHPGIGPRLLSDLTAHDRPPCTYLTAAWVP